MAGAAPRSATSCASRRTFRAPRVVRLEQNYRSTGHILAAASGLIARNRGRLGKTLWTADEGGDKVALRGLWDGEEEARVVADEIEALQRNGHKLNDIAILVRASFQTREFEERFMTLGVPYRVIGGPRFYERQEIRDAIAYLRVIAQPDDNLAFERIVNKPRRGLGDATLKRCISCRARAACRSWARRASSIETDELKPQARNALRRLVERFRPLARPGRGHARTPSWPRRCSTRCGYTAMLQADKSPEAPGRLENLKELVNAMEEFENLAGFLEHVSLVMETTANSAGDMVNLMTLHAAKGLEFETVFLPGWEEGLFPHQRALDESGAAGLEEERRLAYVGLTRARKRIGISFVANRRVHNQWTSAIPSRFIDELPAEHVEIASQPGLYAGRGAGLDDEPAVSATQGDAYWGRDWELRGRRQSGQRGLGEYNRARYAATLDARAEPIDAEAKAQPLRGRHPRLPPEIRLWHGDGRREREARDRFRP